MSRFFEHERQHTSRSHPGQIGSPIHRRSWTAHLGVGLITGVGLGVAARGFMRLLAVDPEFTWSGTVFIVGLFAVFGVVQGGVAAIMSRTTRRRITVPARLMGGLSYLMLGGGAGTLMVPFLWFGALALWRITWHRRVRATLAALAAANMVAVVGLTLSEDGLDRLREPGVVAGFALFAATYAAAVWNAGPTLRPSTPATYAPVEPTAETVTRRAATPTGNTPL